MAPYEGSVLAVLRKNKGLHTPTVTDDDWIRQLLCDQDLASRTEEGDIFPTVGGYLLFAEMPQHHIQTRASHCSLKRKSEVD